MNAADPLFDAYIIVDWSAAAVPRQGADSIWYCHLRRTNECLVETAIANPPTRMAAERQLIEQLSINKSEKLATLIGFDFPIGYPAGFARRVAPDDPTWRSVWQLLDELIIEGPGNANNRFTAAAEINRRASGKAFPFWGCPASQAGQYLTTTSHGAWSAELLAEKRLTELRVTGPQPTWKLYGNGSAGSQALTGIPVIKRLREHPAIADDACIWPFETGLCPPNPRTDQHVVFAEIYPSLVEPRPGPGEAKDSAQVRALARHFAESDAAGRLAPLFAGDPTLSAEERQQVEREEAWILGVTSGEKRVRSSSAVHSTPLSRKRQVIAGDEGLPTPRRYDYLRDPAAIYRRSFELIRQETDLSRLPAELHPVALRLVHAAADPGLVADLVWSPDAVARGTAALTAGAPVLADAGMVAHGIIRERLPARNRIICTLDDPAVPDLARRLGTTRSAAAVELWRPHLDGAVVAIGNAPTSLFHLLEMIDVGAARPALVLGFPVGFVGAAEAKAALVENALGLPFIALRGRRGGSALAAAAINALAAPAEAER